MLFERQHDWLMFAWIGAGYDAFVSAQRRCSESKSWSGTLLYVHANGKFEYWTREKVYLQ